jgi:geranylgeranyl diphosphate synthase type II
MENIDIIKYLSDKKELVNSALKKYFIDRNPLFEMMYYSIDRGKRIRPILAIASYESNGGKNINKILPIACGLELIHTYSLIHDDLPSMDNDDFRRGKASSHKKFGEANAILSGDGLFAYAFELFTEGDNMTKEKISVIRSVSETVGPKGIVYGQVLDITDHKEKSPRVLRKIHLNKTAKFIALSIKVGAVMARAPKEKVDRLYNTGLYLGVLFQYTDDILDVIGKKEKLGKTPKKDLAAGKLTAPSVYGLDGAKFRARRYADLVKKRFLEFGDEFMIFNLLTDFILNRTF